MSIHALQTSLQHETGLIEQFIVILEAEASTLLEPGGNEALEASTHAKNELAGQLAQASAARDALLAQLGYSAGKAGLDAAGLSSPQLQAVTGNLFELAERARQLNAANGYIIETFLKYNQQALDTLRGLAGIGNLYDASGRAQNAPSKAKGIRAG